MIMMKYWWHPNIFFEWSFCFGKNCRHVGAMQSVWLFNFSSKNAIFSCNVTMMSSDMPVNLSSVWLLTEIRCELVGVDGSLIDLSSEFSSSVKSCRLDCPCSMNSNLSLHSTRSMGSLLTLYPKWIDGTQSTFSTSSYLADLPTGQSEHIKFQLCEPHTKTNYLI